MKYWQDRAEDFRKNLCETIKRAEAAERQTLAAEKNNALRLEERAHGIRCDKCGCDTTGEIDTNYCNVCFDAKIRPKLTHWQRFKSWLSGRGK